ncbi:MAG: response regulator transcription factor [Anaerolineae bacterium]
MTSILVVEDHPIFIQSMVRLLRERGKFDVTTASSGEQAVEQLKENPNVDLVLIDVSLPGMSGIRLLRAVHDLKPGLPCLMVSGHLATHYVQQSMAAGARGYVLKEDIPGILEGINQVLSGGQFISQALKAQ